jgi:ubiquinone/menaquinone biosynthesis C-methylase UbiE
VELEEYARVAATEDRHWWYRATRALAQELLAPWLRPGLRALDAGCGPGGMGAWLGEYGTLAGVDISPEALRLLSERHPDIEAVEASIEHLPFGDGEFDVVLEVTVLNQVADDALAARELGRVLRPGGAALLFEPAFKALRRGHDAVVAARRRYRVRELEALARQAGLEVRRSTYCHSYLAPPAAALAAADRLRRAGGRPRSDLERPGLDALFAQLAEAERRLLRKRDLPFGSSALVLGVRPQ